MSVNRHGPHQPVTFRAGLLLVGDGLQEVQERGAAQTNRAYRGLAEALQHVVFDRQSGPGLAGSNVMQHDESVRAGMPRALLRSETSGNGGLLRSVREVCRYLRQRDQGRISPFDGRRQSRPPPGLLGFLPPEFVEAESVNAFETAGMRNL